MSKNCDQCGATPEQSLQMVELANGTRVCDKCVGDMQALMQAGAKEKAQEAAKKAASTRRTPKEIVAFLDDYVIGQEDAKQTLALAVYNHYKRLDNPTGAEVELEKSNILMLGPTGTGKTLLARSVARLLDVPFTIADATSLTQAGYVGDDVETILQQLIQAADGDIAKAERGIVFIDEIDKIAKANAGTSITRDVSGEGVQQALLKLIEGARVSVMKSGNRKTPGTEQNYIDTKNILFICAGAFVPLLKQLKAPKKATTIGFIKNAETDADSKPKEVTPEMLSKFGMIPEFVGRLPVITTLNELTVQDIEHILVQPKNAILRQMEALVDMDGAKLVVEDGAVTALAEQAHKLKTGARAARGVLERLLRAAMFNIPGTTGAVVTLRKDLTVDVDYQEQKLAA
jgi:ATP-dependent Clp protease ATP-binding subunit ClpX